MPFTNSVDQMRLQDIAPVIITFVIIGITLGVGAEVLDDIGSSVTAASVAEGAVKNATESLSVLGGWLPTIGLAIAAASVIGVVVYAFYKFA